MEKKTTIAFFLLLLTPLLSAVIGGFLGHRLAEVNSGEGGEEYPYTKIVNQKNAVVKILAVAKDGKIFLFSGFIFKDEDGIWVASVGHLVENDKPELIEKIYGYFYSPLRKRMELELVGYDAVIDVSLLKFKGEDADNLPAMPLGSSKNLIIGQEVANIGHPAPLSWAITTGKIVSLDYQTFLNGIPTGWIIHDALINPGSSGSPLFDIKGEVIGITSMALSPYDGKFFNFFTGCVPIDSFKEALPRLKKNNKTEAPF